MSTVIIVSRQAPLPAGSWCTHALRKYHRCPMQRLHASSEAKDTWAAKIERMQMETLDRAVSMVNGALSAGEKGASRQNGSSTSPSAAATHSLDEMLAEGGGMAAMAIQPGERTRRIKLHAKSSVYKQIEEVPGRPLADYLSLPVEDYNLLDPDVVRRLDDNRFKLTFPFKQWFRMDMTPELILEIRPDPVNARVLFVCESLKFGQKALDRGSAVSFATAVSRAHVGAADGSGQVYIVSAMQFSALLEIPIRGSRLIPIPVLETFGNQLLGASIKACAQPYLGSLAHDYLAWAKGEKRTAGEIRPGDLTFDAVIEIGDEGKGAGEPSKSSEPKARWLPPRRKVKGADEDASREGSGDRS